MFFDAELDEDVEAPLERRRPVVQLHHVHVQLHVSARHYRHVAVREEALSTRLLGMMVSSITLESSTVSDGGRRGVVRAAPVGVPERSFAGCGPAEDQRGAAARDAKVSRRRHDLIHGTYLVLGGLHPRADARCRA